MSRLQISDILFVVNPNSGRKNAKTILKKLAAHFPDYKIEISRSISDFKRIFLHNKNQHKVFVIVGGDGSVNVAAGEIYKTDNNILAIYPSGSGNGFARELGFSKKIKTLKKILSHDQTTLIDVLLINDSECFNVSGIGFDAFVADDFKNRKRRGLFSYILSVIKAVFKFKSFSVKISNESICIEEKVKMITIANTRQFGNNAIIAPQANPTDGYYDLVIVKPFPFYVYPIFIFKLMTGNLKNSKYVSFRKLKEDIRISSDCDFYHIDGEPFKYQNYFNISVAENKLQVLKAKV